MCLPSSFHHFQSDANPTVPCRGESANHTLLSTRRTAATRFRSATSSFGNLHVVVIIYLLQMSDPSFLGLFRPPSTYHQSPIVSRTSRAGGGMPFRWSVLQLTEGGNAQSGTMIQLRTPRDGHDVPRSSSLGALGYLFQLVCLRIPCVRPVRLGKLSWGSIMYSIVHKGKVRLAAGCITPSAQMFNGPAVVCYVMLFRKDSLKKKQEFTGYDMYDLIMDKFDVSMVCVSRDV